MNKILTILDLEKIERPLWTLDFETYYDPGKQYTLSKMTTVEYVRDPRFKAHGVAVVDPSGNSYWVTNKDLKAFFESVVWQDVAVNCHHTLFDGFILSEIYNVIPGYYCCTMFMSLGDFGPGVSASHEALCHRLERAGKIKGALASTAGIRNLNCNQEGTLAEYGIDDAEKGRANFESMYFDRGFPTGEMHIIDVTLRCFCDPVLRINAALLRAEIEEEDKKLKSLLTSDLVGQAELSDTCRQKLRDGGVENLIASPNCFAELIQSRGVAPPMKPSPSNPEKQTYAFAKTDLELLALGEDPRTSDLVAARLGVKSTIKKTRAETLLRVSDNGSAPLGVPLRYCGARTHRWSGTGGINLHNLSSGRDGTIPRLRQSIEAPKGWRIASVDSSQVECLTEDTLILTATRGYVSIKDVKKSDRLWDGIEWVEHDGVIFKGYKETIKYEGVRGTTDHVVYTKGGGSLTLAEAKMAGATLLVGERGGQAVRTLDRAGSTDTSERQASEAVATMRNMRDGEAVEARRYEERKVGKLLREYAIGAEPVLRHAAEEANEAATSSVQPHSRFDRPKEQDQIVRKLSQAWYQKLVRLVRRVREIYVGALSKGQLFWLGGGPHQQRWALRAGELALGYAGGERAEPTQQRDGGMERGVYEPEQVLARFTSGVLSQHALPQDSSRVDPGADDRVLRPVYDILNAGPRNRFCANGVIVSNCRVHAYLWGEQALLDSFASGGDPYSELASAIYGVHVTKNNENSHLRPIGKAGELSLGFGVGWKKFAHTIRAGMLGPSYDISDEEALRAVETYRGLRKNIVAGWDRMRTNMHLMMSGADPFWDTIFEFHPDKVRMPNELFIRYRKLHYAKEEDTGRWQMVYQYGNDWARIYPAKMGANGTQSAARTVVAEQALEISREFRVVLLVHDEIVFLVPENHADEGLAYGIECMRKAPGWCSGLPLDAEGGHAHNYSK